MSFGALALLLQRGRCRTHHDAGHSFLGIADPPGFLDDGVINRWHNLVGAACVGHPGGPWGQLAGWQSRRTGGGLSSKRIN